MAREEEPGTAGLVYEFGSFRVDAGRRRLWREGLPVPLQARSVDTLIALLAEQPRGLSKGELMARVWGGAFVEESNLTFQISVLRKALGESAREPRFIVTVAGEGYRFVGEVRIGREDGGLSVDDTSAEAARRPVLAVLPFLWLEKPATWESDGFLSLGLADALIASLSRHGAFLVRPTSAVRPFVVTPDQPVAETRDRVSSAAAALRVDRVLEGTLQRTGDRLRVGLQCIDSRTAATIWAERFEAPAGELRAIEQRLADVAVRSLERSSGAVRSPRPPAPPVARNDEAHRLYRLGRYHLGRWTAEGLEKALDCFSQALDRDADFALALCGWAEALGTLWFHGALPPRETVPGCKAAAQRALFLDADSADAHKLLGGFLCWYDWDFAAAETFLLRAAELAPDAVSPHDWLALFYKSRGRFAEAIAEGETAVTLDPTSVFSQAAHAWTFYYARRFDEALAEADRAAALEPRSGVAQWTRGLVLAQLGRFAEALAALESAVESSTSMMASFGWCLGRAGQPAKAREVLAQLKGLLPRYVPMYELAMVHAGLGEADTALSLLERAFEERSPWLVYLEVEPLWDFLRQDSRFAAIAERVRRAD